LLAGVVARSTIPVQKAALQHTRRKHFIDVFFVYPRHAKPEDRRLQNNQIRPHMFLDFGINVVAVLDLGFLDLVVPPFQLTLDDIDHRTVQPSC